MTLADEIMCDFEAKQLNLELFGYGCNILYVAQNPEDFITINGKHAVGKNDSDVKFIYYLFKIPYNMTKLDSTFCRQYPNLERIFFRGIVPQEFENSFQDCAHLESLTLERAEILEIPENLFSTNLNLKAIELPDNKLKAVPVNFLKNQDQLQFLSLEHNLIDSLLPNIFTSTANLITLNLGYNNITNLDPTWFQNLKNLKTLNLNHNKISSLPTNVFVPLMKLKTLSLNDNKLTVINSDAFSHYSTSSIDFSNNRIHAIDEEVFIKTALSSVNLENNYCVDEDFKETNESKLESCYENHKILDVCGRPKIKELQGAIAGGQNITHGDYPWIVAIKEKGKYICGGVLVGTQTVVTAAHCMHDKDKEPKKANDLILILGMHNLSNCDEIGRVIRAVGSIEIHPNWDPSAVNYDADIAVLNLDEKVIFDRYIRPVCLIEPDTPPGDIFNGIVVGYGENREMKVQEVPRVLDMPIHTNEDCFLEKSILADISSKRTFCAGSGNGTGVCLGDSGSGLYVESDGIYYLRGIASVYFSTHIFECNVDTYSIFTNAMKFSDWINQVSGTPYKMRKPSVIQEKQRPDQDSNSWPPIAMYSLIAWNIFVTSSVIAYLIFRLLSRLSKAANSAAVTPS